MYCISPHQGVCFSGDVSISCHLLQLLPRSGWPSSKLMTLQIAGEKYVFSVTGRGLEPYAEERISLECTARTTLTRTLLVPTLMPAQSTSYRVLCDLGMLSGHPKLSVPSAGRAGYTLTLQPHTNGDFLGSVVFLTEAGEQAVLSASIFSSCWIYHACFLIRPASCCAFPTF